MFYFSLDDNVLSSAMTLVFFIVSPNGLMVSNWSLFNLLSLTYRHGGAFEIQFRWFFTLDASQPEKIGQKLVAMF